MRIVYNTDQIYLHGGIEKVMATKANYFATLPGVELYIITTEQKGNDPCYYLDERIHLIDLRIDYNRSSSYFSLVNLKKAVLHFFRQRRLLRKLKPTVIISPNYNFDHYWLPFVKGNIKLVKERHSSRYFEEDQRAHAKGLKAFRFRINDWIDSKYDHIVVLNESEEKYVKSRNAVVIPNPIEDAGLYAKLSNKQVMAAGRISAIKGFDQLIDAWKYVKMREPDWQLHIYGQDYLDTRERLEKLIAMYGLEDVVFFKGSVEDIPKVMTDYSIYAMTSKSECFPMVLLEALSVGLPIVSYDAPNGPRYIVKNGEDGFLTELHDPKGFSEKLILLMQNENLRKAMGIAAKKNANRFITDAVMAQWKSLLNL